MKALLERVRKIKRVLEGGAGSGNFGHAGRPGERGGSGGGGSDQDKDLVSTGKDIYGNTIGGQKSTGFKIPPPPRGMPHYPPTGSWNYNMAKHWRGDVEKNILRKMGIAKSRGEYLRVTKLKQMLHVVKGTSSSNPKTFGREIKLTPAFPKQGTSKTRRGSK